MNTPTSNLATIVYQGHTVEICENGKIIYVDGELKRRHITGNNKGRKGYYAISIFGKEVYVHKLMGLAWHHNIAPEHLDCVGFVNPQRTLSPTRDNTYWTNRATLYSEGRKFKIKEESKIKEVIDRLLNGDTLRAIADDFGVSDMCIHRMRKHYLLSV